MAHDATILHERLVDFGRLNHSYEEKVQAIKAQAEVAKKLLKAIKERERRRMRKREFNLRLNFNLSKRGRLP